MSQKPAAHERELASQLFAIRAREMYESGPAIEAAYADFFKNLPRDPPTLGAVAKSAFAVGRAAEALALLESAIARDPKNPRLHFDLGQCLYTNGRPQRALAANDAFLKLVPKDPDGLNNRGISLMALGRMDEAKAAFRMALKRQANHVAALMNLSVIHEFSAGDEVLTRLLEIERRPLGIGAADLVRLHYTLGRAREQVKDHAGAFNSYAEGAALKRALQGYDEVADVRVFEEVQELFDVPEHAAPPTDEGMAGADPRMIFVIGMPRSGTSLLEQMLASHSKVGGLGEFGGLFEAYQRWRNGAFSSGRREAGALFAPEALEGARRAYLSLALRLIERPHAVLVDKTPMNFVLAGFILSILPDATLLHTTRDPLDTVWSCFSTLFTGGIPWSYEQRELGRFYRRYVGLMAHWQRLYPRRIHDVPYEALVAAPEATLRGAFAAAGLPFEPAVLDFHRTERAVMTASIAQVRRPVYRSAVKRSEAYRPFLTPLIEEMEQPPG